MNTDTPKSAIAPIIAKSTVAHIVADTTSDPLFTEQQAADYLQTAPATLSIWRSTKRYNLPYIKVGRLVRYRKSALDAFLSSRTVTE